MTRRYRRRRRHHPRAYARMTLRGPRVGINFLPGCLMVMIALAGVVAGGILAVLG
jgi:hypothetical protein